MPYRIRRSETVPEGVRRVACEQIDRAVGEIDDVDLDPHETVHQVRKRCKKIRGLLRIVRPQLEETYQSENAFFRDAARELAGLRDAQSMLECYDRLMEHFDKQVDRRQFASIRARLTRERDQLAHQQGDIAASLDTFRGRMLTARERVAEWSIPDEEFDTLRDGFEKTFRRAQRALRLAYDDPTPEKFHEWRKRVKYHRYHCRLLRSIWPSMLNVYRDTADELGDLLGDDHDLAIIRGRVLDAPDEYGDTKDVEAFVALVDGRRSRLQAEARPLGLRMFAHDPEAISAWFATCWRAWRREKKLKRKHARRTALARNAATG